ncbi:MAG: cytochrome C [Acidobacteriota bacterium]
MKRLLKWLGVIIGSLCLIALGSVIYVVSALPVVAAADQTLTIESTPERIRRGEYLAYHVAGCAGCHSIRDWNVKGHPIKPGTEFQGGEPTFDERIGLPGQVYPKNLTPYNLKQYSDGELVRVIRTGVRRDGQPLFPVMPYQAYASMTQEDLYSVIAYLRSLPTKVNDVPEHRLQWPVNVIVHTIPKDAGPFPPPIDPTNTVGYGQYLVKMGSCTDCHTPADPQSHEPLPGMYLAGGLELPYLNNKLQRHPGGGVMRVPNITPDLTTGIGSWTKEAFLERFADWRGDKLAAKHVRLDLDRGEYMPIMPYAAFAGMTDGDLGAIYDYLRTIPPVNHGVVRFDPPKRAE